MPTSLGTKKRTTFWMGSSSKIPLTNDQIKKSAPTFPSLSSNSSAVAGCFKKSKQLNSNYARLWGPHQWGVIRNQLGEFLASLNNRRKWRTTTSATWPGLSLTSECQFSRLVCCPHKKKKEINRTQARKANKKKGGNSTGRAWGNIVGRLWFSARKKRKKEKKKTSRALALTSMRHWGN